MHLLARREHSKSELLNKLIKKKFAAADIELALNQLIQENLLNENRFVENYIHFRSNKGFGPVRIRAELIERGIREDCIEPYLNISDNAWLIQGRKVWQKRFKNQLPHDRKMHFQQMHFLLYRGFTSEQVTRILNNEEELCLATN